MTNNIVRTYREVADHFGISRQVVSKEWKESGMPHSPGRFDLRAIAEWRSLRRPGKGSERIHNTLPPEAKHGRRHDGIADDQYDSIPLLVRKRRAEARKFEAEAARRERENAEAEGRLVDRTVVVREVSELVIRLKQRLSAAPAEMEMMFPRQTRKQNKVDFEEFVRQLLSELSTMQVGGLIADDIILEAADSIIASQETNT
jgi:phage terminase Nu1 subunit (DNA packaging protein)